MLIDTTGRNMRKLRVSLLPECNFRCVYCMPAEKSFERFKVGGDHPKMILDICRYLIDRGINTIRLTGGEPLLYPHLKEVVQGIGRLAPQKFAITTNGFRLERFLPLFASAGLDAINISLDALDDATFFKITRRDLFDAVFSAIKKAKSAGFTIKINTVVMRGINDHQLVDMVKMAAQLDFEWRFLELMAIGEANRLHSENRLMTAYDIQAILQQHFTSVPIKSAVDSTAVMRRYENGARIGFIASESQAFCASCSRLRLSSDGALRACLMKPDGVSLANLPDETRDQLMPALLAMKPRGRIERIEQNMNEIGG